MNMDMAVNNSWLGAAWGGGQANILGYFESAGKP